MNRLPSLLFAGAALALAGCESKIEHDLPGGVWASGASDNVFAYKADVFVEGGAAPDGSGTLPDGNYIVAVTDFRGDHLLSELREVRVDDGRLPRTKLSPFQTSPNGVYKVFVTKASHYPSSRRGAKGSGFGPIESRTDTFYVSDRDEDGDGDDDDDNDDGDDDDDGDDREPTPTPTASPEPTPEPSPSPAPSPTPTPDPGPGPGPDPYDCNAEYGARYGDTFGDMNGNIWGDVYGDWFGDLTGNHYGDHFGDIFGDIDGDIYGDVYGDWFGDLNGNHYGAHYGDRFGDTNGDIGGH